MVLFVLGLFCLVFGLLCIYNSSVIFLLLICGTIRLVSLVNVVFVCCFLFGLCLCTCLIEW